MVGLRPQQVRFFRDLGYLRISGRLDEDLVARLGEVVRSSFVRRPVGGAPGKVYRLYEKYPALMDTLIRHPVILEPLHSLLGQHVVFVTNRHNCGILQSAGFDEAPRLHRDVLQWSRPLLTVLVYLEDSTVENGCTQVVPGSHLAPFVDSGTTGGTWMDEYEQYSDLAAQAVPIPMFKGSALILDATVFHSAGPSQSQGTRMCIALAYRSVDELDVHSRMQRAVLVSGEYVYRGNDAIEGLVDPDDIGGSVAIAHPVSGEARWRS